VKARQNGAAPTHAACSRYVVARLLPLQLSAKLPTAREMHDTPPRSLVADNRPGTMLASWKLQFHPLEGTELISILQDDGGNRSNLENSIVLR
jgi:hypothetical protein